MCVLVLKEFLLENFAQKGYPPVCQSFRFAADQNSSPPVLLLWIAGPAARQMADSQFHPTSPGTLLLRLDKRMLRCLESLLFCIQENQVEKAHLGVVYLFEDYFDV